MLFRVAGEYTSSVVILQLPHAVVAAMLPPELELAPQSLSASGTHPVVLSFNEQRNVCLQAGPFSGPKFNYLEFAVGVPYTQLTDPDELYRGPFFFAPLLYLNLKLAILAGLIWGFAKHDAEIAATPTTFTITHDLPPAPILRAVFERRGARGNLASFPLARGLGEMLDQPGIGKTVFGPLLSFELRQNLKRARVQALDVRIHIVEQFLNGIPPGNYAVSGLDQVPLGAYRMITNWWLEPPLPPEWASPESA